MKIFSVLFIILLSLPGLAQQDTGVTEKKGFLNLQEETKISQNINKPLVEWTPRKIRATALSALIPGTGQTYLGSEIKGIAITLGFVGSGLTAVLNHNNFVAREDRISDLLAQYATKMNYPEAEKIWESIIVEKNDRQRDYDRRKLFTYATIAIWVYNVIDVIFLTDDKGVMDFSFKPVDLPGTFALASGTNKIFDFRINLF